MLEAVTYVRSHKMEQEANRLANKVGNIYMACLILYQNIPQTEENIKACKRIVERKWEEDKINFEKFLKGV